MPIYDYRCKDCNFKFAMIIGVTEGKKESLCPRCNSKNLSQLISMFHSKKSYTETLDLLDKKMENVDLNDPRSMTKAMKDMGKYLSDEAESDAELENYDKMMDNAEKEVYDSKGSSKLF